jgi:large subunit ribosomal protein L22
MTGPKLNEKSFVAGERAGTKASAKYVHMSASKVRVVLDLVRGLPVKAADEVLQFTDREAAVVVRKVLASAVANAVHNDEQDADELFVLACYADEGPTLKRFTPRARGRAGRIKKRTAHITVLVARLDDDRLEIVQARDARRTAAGRRRAATGGTVASRRDRVERSRQRAAGLKSGDEGTTDSTDSADSADSAVAEATDASAPTWAGSAAPLADGSAPEGFDIKGNADSMLYHVPGSRYYKQTVAEVWFDTTDSAEAAGFSAPGSTNDDESTSADDAETAETAADGEES